MESRMEIIREEKKSKTILLFRLMWTQLILEKMID